MEVTNDTDVSNSVQFSKMTLPINNEQDFYLSFQPNVSDY